MRINKFRERMESFRSTAEEEAKSLKDSYVVLDRLCDLYRKFDAEERELADQVLAEWVMSDDEGVRFDALSLIKKFGIANARPALQDLSGRLATSSSPGAPYERKKVDRVLSTLVNAKTSH